MSNKKTVKFNINTHGFKEMWSHYLFNSFNAIKGDDLLEESIIRKNELNSTKDETETKSDTLTISAQDFMTDGPGKYVNGANFGVINRFFGKSLLGDYDTFTYADVKKKGSFEIRVGKRLSNSFPICP